MVPLLPPLKDNKKIYIICEGSEEYDYLNQLKLLNVWSDVYDITLRDAKGNGNLYPIYQNVYQKGNYDLVVIVCDTEKKPHEQFNDICCKVNSLHACELASQYVVMFTNPCTMQVILLHWDTFLLDCRHHQSGVVLLILKNIQVSKIIQLKNLSEHNWFLILQKRVIEL